MSFLTRTKLRIEAARLEERVRLLERMAADHAEAERASRSRCERLENEIKEKDREIRLLMDSALQAAGTEPAFHPRIPPPLPEKEHRPIRRLRDWRREMEFLEAQAFARRQRPAAGADDTSQENA
jgi:hypothetical protein